MAPVATARPRWWGGSAHIAYTLTVFIVLASLDNAALAMLPSMVKPVGTGAGVSETGIGIITGAQVLVTALAAVAWGYAGDARQRKPLLLSGTVIWATAEGLSATAGSFSMLLLWQVVAAVGLGAIASVGFSVIADFVGPARRGLAMSFWGISQGIGGWLGLLLASQLGATDFRIPLVIMAFLGLLFAGLYLFAFDPPRGFREPELRALQEAGGVYGHRIDRSQLPRLFRRRTNIWLVLQGITAQVAYGSLVWVPLLYQEKVVAEGYGEATATRVGGLFSALFLTGALTSILAGHIGDRLQRRTLRARALVSAAGILGAIPFFLAFFWIPLRGLQVTEGGGTPTLTLDVLQSLFTNPWVAAAFITSLAALSLTSANSPNWFALISDVNLPEHRGTVFGLGNMANGIGRAAGTGLTGALAGAIERAVPPPFNWAIGLSVFQLFFLPTGWCYWKASQTCPGDIEEVRGILAARGRA